MLWNVEDEKGILVVCSFYKSGGLFSATLPLGPRDRLLVVDDGIHTYFGKVETDECVSKSIYVGVLTRFLSVFSYTSPLGLLVCSRQIRWFNTLTKLVVVLDWLGYFKFFYVFISEFLKRFYIVLRIL